MKPEQAISALRDLQQQARDVPPIQTSGPEHGAWTAKVVAVLDRGLGPTVSTVERFKKLRYSRHIYTGQSAELSARADYFRAQVMRAILLLDAAVYELELLVQTAAIEAEYYDAGLWAHVKHSVDEERWTQVASDAAIYVEDKVRRWAGSPANRDGGKRVGKDLFAMALAPGGPIALGSQASETEGWRNLAMGLASAVGNVDRHTIQERPDAMQYAIGVLGLASLLLTQIRYEHPDAVAGTRP